MRPLLAAFIVPAMLPKHPETFYAMNYSTEDGSVNEIIWNARDGVTPYAVPSPDGQLMKHLAWHLDQRVPYHRPAVGSRVFIDLTIEKARESRRLFVEQRWEQLRERWATREEAVEDLARIDFDDGHTPDLVAVTQEMLLPCGHLAVFRIEARIDESTPHSGQEIDGYCMPCLGEELSKAPTGVLEALAAQERQRAHEIVMQEPIVIRARGLEEPLFYTFEKRKPPSFLEQRSRRQQRRRW